MENVNKNCEMAKKCRLWDKPCPGGSTFAKIVRGCACRTWKI